MPQGTSAHTRLRDARNPGRRVPAGPGPQERVKARQYLVLTLTYALGYGGVVKRAAPVKTVLRRQFSSLSVYNYRVYFAGQTVSLVGTWMQTTGQAWLVLRMTGSPLALGTVTALQFLPIMLFTLFGGVFADRLPKRRMLVITQSLALLQASVLAVLVVTGSVELWHVYVLALFLGTINAFDGPVRQAFVVELVGRENLVNAVALNSSIFNVARIVGPGVAGLMIAYIGLSATFFTNAVSFIGVLGAYAAMRPAEFQVGAARPRPVGNVFRQVGQGLGYAWKTPSLMFFFIMLSAIGTFGFNFTVVIPLVAEFVLKVGPERFGLMTSSMGAGSLVAALSLAAFGRVNTKVLITAALAFAVLLAAVAESRSFPVTTALLFLFGICSLTFSTTINTSIQLAVPDELRGRVMSIFFLLMAGSTPIGGVITGKLAGSIGVAETLTIEAGVCALGVGVALLYRELAGRRSEAAPSEPVGKPATELVEPPARGA